eukprot:2676569-Amphidinium_carterae.1
MKIQPWRLHNVKVCPVLAGLFIHNGTAGSYTNDVSVHDMFAGIVRLLAMPFQLYARSKSNHLPSDTTLKDDKEKKMNKSRRAFLPFFLCEQVEVSCTRCWLMQKQQIQ